MSQPYTLNDVSRHRLSNGLTVLLREDHSSPIVSSMIWYRVGSRLEAPGNTGISHLLEHMMFKGTEKYGKGEIDYITARHGGANNAFTSRDYTAYYFSFASDRWYPALEIEADRMVNSSFEADEFDLEKQVVLEELRMDLDSPWGALGQAVEFNSFKSHPYRFPVIGTYEDVSRVELEQLNSHYRSYYTPNNAVLVAVGDFDRDEVLSMVTRLFETIPAQPVASVKVPREPRRQGFIRLDLHKPAHVPRMLWAFPAPCIRHPDHYGLDIIDRALSEGKLGRLHTRLVEEERVASAVDTEFDETWDPFLFFIQAELQPDVSIGRVERIVNEEIGRLQEDLLTEEEFERARNQCLAQFLADFETPLDQSVQIGLLETLDRFEYWNSYQENIEKLTPARVRDTARHYLTTDQLTLGTLTDDDYC